MTELIQLNTIWWLKSFKEDQEINSLDVDEEQKDCGLSNQQCVQPRPCALLCSVLEVVEPRLECRHFSFPRYCSKCLSDGIDPEKASVVYRNSTFGTTTMSHDISKFHAGEEAPTVQKNKRSAESSESDSRAVKPRTVQSALPVVRQVSGQTQEELNVMFVVNVILKMGLHVSMADNEGFREWKPLVCWIRNFNWCI